MKQLLEPVVGSPVRMEELKHKPGRRRVLRACGGRRTAIVKFYASDRAPLVAARLAALATGPAEPQVPRVLQVDPDRRMVVLSELEGEPLRAAIVSGDVAACARVGVALAAWHSAWRNTSCDAFAPHTIEDETRILLAQASDARPVLRAAVRARLRALTAPWRCTTVVHRDLYEEQILLGERVGLIDLDDAALGPPELDLGNLLAHVELLGLREESDFGPAAQAVVDGYGPSLDSALLRRCRELATLRLACIHDLPALLGHVLEPREVRA